MDEYADLPALIPREDVTERDAEDIPERDAEKFLSHFSFVVSTTEDFLGVCEVDHPAQFLERFVSHFGVNVVQACFVWELLLTYVHQYKYSEMVYFFWALYFLRRYQTEIEAATRWKVSENTYRKHMWDFVEAISKIPNVIDWEKRKIGSLPYNRALVSIDGTDFEIVEPVNPRDKSWYSYKFNAAAVKYEVAVCITTGCIVWINGPFKGSVNDNSIAWGNIVSRLDPGERIVADSGYHNKGDRPEVFYTKRGDRSIRDRQMSVVRSRHETVNRRFKEFKAMQSVFRHDVKKHQMVMYAIAILVQVKIEDSENMVWELEYDERMW